MNALVNIETLTAATVFAPGGVEIFISKLESDVRAMPKPDILTEGGREEIKSLAYKIARSKTALDDLGKDFVAELKKQTGKIDADRRIIRDRLDALKDEVRKPVTEWEGSEKARVDAHEAALTIIRGAAELGMEASAPSIRDRLRTIGQVAQRDWQEFAEQANGALAVAEDKLRGALIIAEKREAEAAELKRLQEAEQVRIAAEAKAKRDADAAATAAVAEAQRLEREKAAAERARVAAEEAAARAVEQERQRVAAEKAATEAAEQKRQANKRTRDKINREITSALSEVLTGNADEAAALIDAIVAGRIPHVTITY